MLKKLSDRIKLYIKKNEHNVGTIDDIPNLTEIKLEYKKLTNKKKFFYELKRTLAFFVSIIALGIIISTFWIRILTIHGTSMSPNLVSNDAVIAVKKQEYKKGDIIAFYYNNKILVKRIIGTSGNWINISQGGDVTINGKNVKEKYLNKSKKSIGIIDVKLPYQVPEDKFFVMGDQRSISIDSRNKSIGSIGKEQIIGKLEFRVWPLQHFNILK
ncbi:MAG: signal peptidase I [Lactococcus chungangensis]|jgi:signal peptidase I, bacterial type|nr:signal peptidase I [Lactococcus chungangensis]